ncbi:MAG: hypothetical protein M3Z37_04860 [Candidatus Eremiobacteraeota bacterium]|nr:hypothetical protein [Candidatus Eremiobacteraeota bacterium]
MRLSRYRSLAGLPLLCAAAWLAAAAGHGVQLGVESLRWFGEARASYAHSAQSIVLETAIFAAGIGIFAAFRRLWPRRSFTPSSLALPTLAEVLRLGRARSVAFVLSFQFISVTAIELLEQRLSGAAHPSIAAIFGPAHVSAVFVYAIVGIVLALATYAFADAVVLRSRRIACMLGSFVRRLQNGPISSPLFTPRCTFIGAAFGGAPLLSLGIANRPPPR